MSKFKIKGKNHEIENKTFGSKDGIMQYNV